MKRFMCICSAVVAMVFIMNVDNLLAGKSTTSHDWKQEAEKNNPDLAKKVTELADRLRAVESTLDAAKENGSKTANNIRGGIYNLRLSMESLYEALGGREVVKKRLDNAYKGVGSRRRMVENMFKRADFPNAQNHLNEFKNVLRDLDSLRPDIEKAIL